MSKIKKAAMVGVLVLIFCVADIGAYHLLGGK